jgi:hypothetical protein
VLVGCGGTREAMVGGRWPYCRQKTGWNGGGEILLVRKCEKEEREVRSGSECDLERTKRGMMREQTCEREERET